MLLIHFCRALSNGGGVLAMDLASVTTASRISGNRAKRCGGGIAILDQSSVHFMRGTEILSNGADMDGGGIYSAGLYTIFGEVFCEFRSGL